MRRPFPGAVWGGYPQRGGEREPWASSAWRGLRQLAGGPRAARYRRFARKVAERDLSGSDAALVKDFVRACETMESTLQVRPYPSQVMAARIMLDGCLAEMATGEGKTVAIALAAAIAALGNTPVHVITANDYLASRDAQAMAPFFQALGLAVGAVTQPMDQAQRRAAWACHVTYCTAKELVFDYLRDGLAGGRGLADLEQRARRLAAGPQDSMVPLLRGLSMAIVDEADTVLIDEAGVPLVLSQPAPAALEHGFLQQAAGQAGALREGTHFTLAPDGKGVSLTDAGRERLLQDWPPARQPAHNDSRHREDTAILALTALHGLRRDRDYVVRDGSVILVDETTGRAAPGRAWSRGLHQLVEIKEGCAFTGRNSTVSQITFQRFFPRYLHLCGMSGTVAGSAWEMSSVYALPTVVVPPRLPSLRRSEPLALLPDSPALWQAVCARVNEVHATGRPVLVGTGSVAESEQLSAVLHAAGLAHTVLNARQDSGESEVIAAAGQRGRITVATSMAGRGTDIVLGDGVAALGGLHVILCQHNVSRRIDRQFIGRAARQGQPGGAQALLALDFPLMRRWLPAWWRRLAAKGLPPPLLHLTARWPQWVAAYTQRKQRQTLCRADEETERELSFNREKFS
ncbi:MAG: hypothetical protein HYX47_22275 [Burkholderiales bacterium]|nr:hypothetical protein [Burkholderiales bacterium]